MPRVKEKVLTEHWRIEDFFIAAAERKGAELNRIKGKARRLLRQVVRSGKAYKLSFTPGTGITFDIHSDGTWRYVRRYHEGKSTILAGRLQCPHAKGWIKKMIDKGTPGEFAKADWAEHFAIRHLP